jgi:hypothetical protein
MLVPILITLVGILGIIIYFGPLQLNRGWVFVSSLFLVALGVVIAVEQVKHRSEQPAQTKAALALCPKKSYTSKEAVELFKKNASDTLYITKFMKTYSRDMHMHIIYAGGLPSLDIKSGSNTYTFYITELDYINVARDRISEMDALNYNFEVTTTRGQKIPFVVLEHPFNGNIEGTFLKPEGEFIPDKYEDGIYRKLRNAALQALECRSAK